MRITHCERGATLIEAIVAGGLLVTIATGTATLITLAHRLGIQAEQLMAATSIATARLQTLRAIPWDYGLDGSAGEVATLAPTPVDALERNTAGCSEVLDNTGRAVSEPGAGPDTYTVRWKIRPSLAAVGDTRSIEICVFVWPASAGAPPLACVASTRTRQP
jgi:hypothetical protein